LLKIFGNTFEIEKKKLEKAAQAAFEWLSEDFEVNLSFVSERRIKELNRVYRNRDLTTDVLSFVLDPNEHGGDIAICYKEVKRQASHWRMGISESAAFLMVHGMLHLAGYDHLKTADRARMEQAESAILKTVGINVER
jgi:probable rRNA maturation factor